MKQPKFIIVGNRVCRPIPDSMPSYTLLDRFYPMAKGIVFSGHPEPEGLNSEESRALDYCVRQVRNNSR